jgi:hypothetical protein
MPKIGRRKKLFRDLEYIFLFRLSEGFLNPPEPSVIQQLTTDYLTQREIVKSLRYAGDRSRLVKIKTWYEDILPSLRGSRFRQQLRMNQSTFKFVVSLIEGKQMPQLANLN